jgi:hypothetical protein
MQYDYFYGYNIKQWVTSAQKDGKLVGNPTLNMSISSGITKPIKWKMEIVDMDFGAALAHRNKKIAEITEGVGVEKIPLPKELYL